MSMRSRALFFTGLLVAVSCSDAGTPLGPDERGPKPVPPGALQALDCAVSIRGGALRCVAPQPGTGAALGAGTVIVGGQGLYVRLAASGFGVDAVENTISFDVDLENLLGQALGTVDGTTPANGGAEALRIFFYQELQSLDADDNVIGTATVENPTGTGMYLGASTPYFEYGEVVPPNETSGKERWTLGYVEDAEYVAFKVYVWAAVQFEHGFIRLEPSSPTIAPGDTVQLTSTVLDHLAQIPYAVPVTWSSSDETVTTVDADGRVAGESFGTATITASATINSSRGNNLVVTGSTTVTVNSPITAHDVSYPAIGNVALVVPAAYGLKRFVTDADGPANFSIVPLTDAPTAQGGTISVAADGSFTYRGAPGVTDVADEVTYEATDGVATSSAKLTLDLTGMYWYVQGAAGDPAGDGRRESPFNTLKAAETASAAGHTIFVLHAGASTTGVDAGIVLKSGQSLIGQGIPAPIVETLTLPAYGDPPVAPTLDVTLLASGDAPGITRSTAGPTVQLATDNVVRGLGITSTNGAGIQGSSFGTLTTGELGVSAAGPALMLENGTLAGGFLTLSSTNSTGRGLSLTGVAGTLAPAGGAISGAAAEAIYVSGGTVALTYGGAITNSAGRAVHVTGRSEGAITLSGDITDAGTGILVENNTGGTVSFTGASKSLSTGASAAVTLSSNGGATVGFAGGGLQIATTTGAGFTATGGGVVTVTGANNTVSAQGGAAVRVENTTIGATGITFRSVSANGGANGIVLNATGASGGLQVTGDGATPNSGGVIQNTTGYPVSLTGTHAVTLARMSLAGTGGVMGSTFGTLTLDNTAVAGTGAPALNLSTGTVAGTVSSLMASGAANGVALTGVAGSLAVPAGTVTGGAGAAVFVSGGSVSLDWQAAIAQANAFPAISIAGAHSGTLSFTGALAVTGTSTGLAFADADGTYTVSPSGAVTFAAPARVLINSGSAGGFTFGGNLSVVHASGAAAPFELDGSSASVAFNGGLSKTGGTGAVVRIVNQSAGTVTFQNGAVGASAGDGILLSNADGTVSFTGTTTLSGGARILVQNGSSGAISFGANTTVTNPASPALEVNNTANAANVSYAGTITTNNGRPAHVQGVSGGSVSVTGNLTSTGQGLLVQSNSGGTVTFSGASKSLTTGANAAVTLTNNTNASVVFSGGGLAITTTSGAGFAATGGGTVQVTGANNVIASGTGTALRVENTTIGASGLTFRSISHSGGANGIVLVSTGGSNGLQVTGTGTAGSGGSITNTMGADGATSGNGIYLSGVTNVVLDRMILTGHANHGVYGSGVSGFSLANSTVQSNGTNAGGSGEGGIYFLGLTGTSAISGTTVNQHASGNGLFVYNTAGTLNLAVSGSTFSNSENDGVLVEAHNSANVTVSVGTTNFSANKGDHVQVAPNNASVVSATITGGTFSGGHPTALGQGITMRAGGPFSGTFTYDINGITINSAISYAINTGFGSTTGTGLVQGKIRNNTIGTGGVALSGSAQASCILAETNGGGTGTHNALITNNTLRSCYDRGIEMIGSRDGNNTLNVTVTGNNISDLNGPFSRHAIHLESGSSLLSETGAICADIASNTMTAVTAVDEMRVRLRSNPTVRFRDYTGGDIAAYLQARNPAGGTASVSTTVTVQNTNPAGSACPTPP